MLDEKIVEREAVELKKVYRHSYDKRSNIIRNTHIEVKKFSVTN